MSQVHLEAFAAPRPTAVVRRRATRQQLPQVVPQCCGLVWNAIRAASVPGAGRHVALYLDDQINLEVGVELESPWPGAGEVFGSALPAGTVASVTHYGPHQQLFQAHQAIERWCQASDHQLAGPSWEIYGHWDNAWNNDPSQIRTDVYYLLKNAPGSVP